MKFLYHGQYLGFFEKFRKKKERKEGQESLLFCSTEERRIREI